MIRCLCISAFLSSSLSLTSTGHGSTSLSRKQHFPLSQHCMQQTARDMASSNITNRTMSDRLYQGIHILLTLELLAAFMKMNKTET